MSACGRLQTLALNRNERLLSVRADDQIKACRLVNASRRHVLHRARNPGFPAVETLTLTLFPYCSSTTPRSRARSPQRQCSQSLQLVSINQFIINNLLDPYDLVSLQAELPLRMSEAVLDGGFRVRFDVLIVQRLQEELPEIE